MFPNSPYTPCSNSALWEYGLYAKGVTVGSDSAVISVQGYGRVGVGLHVCRLCVRAFTKGSALRVSMHLCS